MVEHSVNTCSLWGNAAMSTRLEKHTPELRSSHIETKKDTKFSARYSHDKLRAFFLRPSRKLNYAPGPLICDATALKVLDDRVPMVLTAPKQMTMMSESMTAYSTAVGPSSARRNRLNWFTRFFIGITCEY